MNALISGQAAVAILVDGDQVSSFTWDDPYVLVPRRLSDLRMLFGTATDVVGHACCLSFPSDGGTGPFLEPGPRGAYVLDST